MFILKFIVAVGLTLFIMIMSIYLFFVFCMGIEWFERHFLWKIFPDDDGDMGGFMKTIWIFIIAASTLIIGLGSLGMILMTGSSWWLIPFMVSAVVIFFFAL